MELVEKGESKSLNGSYVDDKCETSQEVDEDKDGVAVAVDNICLPPQLTSDHIYTEVVSNILLDMAAAGLKREPMVILRIDGEDLIEFINSPRFEPEAITIFSLIDLADGSITDYITKALEHLTVDHGMPPSSDSWVMSNIVEPVLQLCMNQDQERPISQETFLEEFKKVTQLLSQHLNQQPIIVAHCEHTFDGNGIKRLLSNNFEFNKTLDAAMKDLPRDCDRRMSKEYLRIALDLVGPTAGLPPSKAHNQVDNIVNEIIKMVDTNDGSFVEEEEFKKLMMEILESTMLKLEGSPILISSNSVVHKPLT